MSKGSILKIDLWIEGPTMAWWCWKVWLQELRGKIVIKQMKELVGNCRVITSFWMIKTKTTIPQCYNYPAAPVVHAGVSGADQALWTGSRRALGSHYKCYLNQLH